MYGKLYNTYMCDRIFKSLSLNGISIEDNSGYISDIEDKIIFLQVEYLQFLPMCLKCLAILSLALQFEVVVLGSYGDTA